MSTHFASRAARRKFDAEVLEWISVGMQAWLSGQSSLDEALCLNRANRVRAHNAAIIAAARLIRQQMPGLSNWAVAGRLAKAIRHFETKVMPMLKADPGRSLSDIELAIYDALETGHRGPRTQRKLFDLIN